MTAFVFTGVEVGAAPAPLLYYDFEEGAGLGDGSTITNKALGVVTDGLLHGTGSVWTVGAPGGASPTGGLVFDGVASGGGGVYIETLYGADQLGLQGTGHTMTAWIRFTKAGGDAMVFGQVASVDNFLHNGLRGSKAYLGHYGSDVSGVSALSTGVWYHVAWQFDHGVERVFVNGKLDGLATGRIAVRRADPVVVGDASQTGTRAFRGVLDELTVFDEVLTTEQIQHLVDGGSPNALPEAAGDGEYYTGPYGPGGTWNLYKVVGGAEGYPTSWYNAYLNSTNADPVGGVIRGHLVSIHSRGEQEFVRRIQRVQTVGGQYVYVGDAWIGLTDNDTNSVGLFFPGAHESGDATQEPDVNVRRTNGWVWTSAEPYDGSTFMNWLGSEPNDLPSEDGGVILSNGQWNDAGTGIPGSGDPTNDRVYVVEWDIGAPAPIQHVTLDVKQVDPVISATLPGPEGAAGTFGAHRVGDAGGIGELRVASRILASGAGTIVTTNSGIAVINTYDPDVAADAHNGLFPNNDPVFGDALHVTNDSNYAIVYKGRIRIGAVNAGLWTFGMRSDDGCALRIVGQEWLSAHGSGWIDHTDRSVLSCEYGAGSTRGVVDLTEGDYLVEFVAYQGGGEQYQELFAAMGEWHEEGDTDAWRLVGYTGIGDYGVPGVLAPGWTVWHSNPGAHGGIVNTSTAWNAVSPYVQAGSNQTQWGEINFLDPESGGEQELLGSVPFPFDTPGDDNSVAMYMTAKLQILSNDTYRLGFRGDDGSWLQVVSQTWDSIVHNQIGKSVIENDKIVLDENTGNSRTIGAITLPEGEYAVNALWWENGGGASFDIFCGNGSMPAQAVPTTYIALAGDGARIENDADGLPLGEERYDFGDAPVSYSTYAASTGAMHSVVFGAPFLGEFVDVETDGQPTAAADGDDLLGSPDDEDGIIFTSLFVPGQGFTLTVDGTYCPTDGVLNAWIDYDGDGSWNYFDEHVFKDVLVPAGGLLPLGGTVPVSASAGTTYARFRVSSKRGIAYNGYIEDGEVEDYAITIEEAPPQDGPKWIQRPDLSEQGMDVRATEPFVLADDFKCTVTEPITSIVVWASWYNDETPFGSASNVEFTLSFHTDIPTNEIQRYSTPGEVIWTQRFTIGMFEVEVERDGLMEGWYDPERDEYDFPGDTICYRYTFPAVATNIFTQHGTTQEPVVYWLDVQAHPRQGSPALFGWKTSETNWNDDAVWGEGREPFAGPWDELIYPEEHPRRGDSIDLAFALYGGEEEPQEELDWGDAPSPYWTLAMNTGAHHAIGGPWLGDATDGPDPELDGQQDPNALGDDNDGNDDEDGVTIPTLVQGQTSNITIQVNSQSGLGGGVDIWIDYDRDGRWSPAENVYGGSLPNGPHSISVTPPMSSVVGQTFARFRISTAGGHAPTGGALDGEVEDHEVIIMGGVEPEPAKWVQRPDLSPEGMDVNCTEPALLADDFECRYTGPITNVVVWGSWYKDELPQGGPASWDFVLSFHSDIPTNEVRHYSMPGEVLWFMTFTAGTYNVGIEAEGLTEGWYDPLTGFYTNEGDTICFRYEFPIAASNAFVQSGTTNAPVVHWLDVQAVPHEGDVARFGWKTADTNWNDDAVWGDGQEPYTGVWNELRYPNGHPRATQSVDLAFAIYTGEEEEPEPQYDWGDAPDDPYPTLAISTGAHHRILGPFMGPTVDAEQNGVSTVQADGDDLNDGWDDEDGIVFPAPLVRGNTATVLVDMVSSPSGALINAWFDFDGDGKWRVGTSEQILSDAAVTAGVTNALTFSIPWSARMGSAYARFRCDSAGGLWPSGSAGDGEVEDYVVDIYQPDPGQVRFTNTVWYDAGTVKVEWVSIPNIEYVIESTTNLVTVTNTGWSYELTVTGPVNSVLMRIPSNVLHRGEAAFYRVRVPNTP